MANHAKRKRPNNISDLAHEARPWYVMRQSKKIKEETASTNAADFANTTLQNEVTLSEPKLITISFKYKGNIEAVPVDSRSSTADLALGVWERLKISPWNLKLISAGKRISINPDGNESVRAYEGKLVVIIGHPQQTVQHFRDIDRLSNNIENYHTKKWDAAKRMYMHMCKQYNEALAVARTQPPIPTTGGRVFGPLVSNPATEQDIVSWLFGQGLFPDLECTCRPERKISVVGCKTHQEIFLLGLACVTRLRLEAKLQWRAIEDDLFRTHQLRAHMPLTRELENKKKRDMGELYSRCKRMWTALENRDSSFLQHLRDELNDLHRILNFCPYDVCDRDSGAPMVNSNDLDIVADLYSLEMGIEILRGDYDESSQDAGNHEGNEERELTKLPFFTFRGW